MYLIQGMEGTMCWSLFSQRLLKKVRFTCKGTLVYLTGILRNGIYFIRGGQDASHISFFAGGVFKPPGFFGDHTMCKV